MYLAAVMDLFSRKIIGWAMRDHLRVELVSSALSMALRQQRPAAGLIHHSDHGAQHASHHYRAALAAADLTASMSRKADCYDNAPMESFFHLSRRTSFIIVSTKPVPRPSAISSPSSRASTTAHQNTHLSMLLKRRDFADWDAILWGILGSVALVRR
ncbi:DDE-type integrase/transposase/recombinase [Bradyrhizobium sp. CB3481]|uniref:DDE-type integrase/transposase/recombinase n=1 Tax=Bradyrhizobium sp. CB3481 TaxID=3039158 RepID=UPI0024B109FF|nr:DDE-type integrase/transposase/recombinase [Bradyrhizobium sp. CB3481]WFU14540.1 DDE-type integrase/transposase/recombinase [Bradyrhizobium sp. CB3481]